VAPDENLEDRLRELMRDPGWSLPTWTDPEARIRRVARKQRLRVAGVAAGGSAVVAAALIVSLAGFQFSAAPVAGGAPRAALEAFALPAIGAAGFPAALYPAALSRRASRLTGGCPYPAGLEPAVASIRAEAVSAVRGLGRSFRTDLRRTDRTYWRHVQAGWRNGKAKSSPGPVLYAAPLATPQAAGQNATGPKAGATRSLARIVRTDCGNKTTADSWVVVTGSPGRSASQSAYLVLDRRGHLLVWNEEHA
jgi:hypothetical protein